MSSLAAELALLLDGIDRPGDFYTSGTSEILAPGLEVEGVGAVALPLLPVQSEQLIAVADQAPYGRGEETLLDTNVRRTWQIAADKVAFRGRHWARTLDGIVARVAEGLGVAGPVSAELYKLLVYDAGGFFVEHRDTEKAEGMFGTLVIVLPSTYDGGELALRHAGHEVTLDLRTTDPSEAGFAAFYADCRHEVRPVTSGCRLTLIYNLLRPGRRPEPPAYDDERDRLTTLLAGWGEDDPLKLIYPLEHAYTPAALSFNGLKGADAARAGVMVSAAERAGCEAHLALVTIEESGSAEYSGNYRRRYRYDDVDDDDEFEVGEVFDRAETLSDWHRSDGGDPGLGPLPFSGDQVSPPGALDDLDPTEQSFHEATGNEGASFERTYRVAALVLWPRRHRLAVIAEGGLGATLPALARLAEIAGDDRESPHRAEAHDLAGLMLAAWPKGSWRPAEETGRFLTLLVRLGDGERIGSFLAEVAAAGHFAAGDAEAVAEALRRLPAEQAVGLAVRIMDSPAGFDARTSVLARCGGFDLRAAAAQLVESLPDEIPPLTPWDEPEDDVTPAVAVDFVTALAHIDPVLLDAALDAILARPAVWNMDRVLIPAILRLGDTSPRLRDAGLAFLRARIALPLAPPADWARDPALTCSCPHCAGLARFLADPAQPRWEFRAAQAQRTHVETTIANSKCDVDTATVRKGSPHTLVCTKNQASYEARARQRQGDLTLLERL